MSAQQVRDPFDLLRRDPGREGLGEGTASSEGPAIALIQLALAGGPLLRAQLPPQEVAEERIVGVVLTLALERGDEQAALDQPRKDPAHVRVNEDLGTDVGVDEGGNRGSEQELPCVLR